MANTNTDGNLLEPDALQQIVEILRPKISHYFSVGSRSISGLGKIEKSTRNIRWQEGNHVLSSSTRETIKRKLTARVLPMTRNRESTTEEHEANLPKSVQQTLAACTPVQTVARSFSPSRTCYPTNTSTARTFIKSEKLYNSPGLQCQRGTVRQLPSPQLLLQYQQTIAGPNNIDKEFIPPAKKLCLLPVEPEKVPVEQVKRSIPLSPEPRLMGDNIATMSLLSASECHLATLQDVDGDTPVHIAIAQCNVHLVQYLISLMSCLTLDICNNLKQTPLHLAVITNQPIMVRSLVNAGANINIPDRNGQTPAHLACQRSSVDCLVCLIVGRDPLDLDVKNFEGLMPLHEAVSSSSEEVIHFLVSNGANIDCKDGKSGRTPLHHAVETENLAAVEILVKLGADINAASYSGSTVLHIASGRGMHHVSKILLGANHRSHQDPRTTQMATTSKRSSNSKRKSRY